MNQPARITDVEIEGRLIELAQQRDAALNNCIIRAGEIAMLRNRIRELEHALNSVAPKLDGAASHATGNGAAQPDAPAPQ